MHKHFLIIFGLLFVELSLSGQCPGKDSLWHRIVYLRDSTEVPAKIQLTELNNYLYRIKKSACQIDSAYALLLLRIGWLYSLQNDFVNAIKFTNESIDIIHKNANNPKINESHLIKCYNNLQILYDSTGQNKLRMKAIDSCISLAIKLKSGYIFAIQHISTEIQYHFDKGDYYKSMNYALIGEDVSKHDNFRPQDLDYYSIWKITSLVFLHEYQTAKMMAEKSMAQCIRVGNSAYIGSYLVLLAYIADEMSDSSAALKYSGESIKQNSKFGNYYNCAATLNNLALYLYFQKLHDNDKALFYYFKALKYANGDFLVEIMNNIANAYIKKGDFNNAFKMYDSAFEKIFPEKNREEILSKPAEEILQHVNAEYIVKLTLDIAEANIEKYKLFKNQKDIQTAISMYKAADRLMDRIKISQTDLSSKLFWRADTRRLYEKAIESCYLSHNMEDVFYFFEKSRAVLLNDQLKEQETSDPNLSKMAVVKKEILDLERNAGSLNTDSDFQRKLFMKRDQLSRLDQLVKENNSWYYQSLTDTNFIGLKAVQGKLLEDLNTKGIVEFFNGDSAIYALTITPEKSHITKMDRAAFENKADRYISWLSNASMENRDFNGFLKTGQDLYQLIFNEFPVPVGRIVISPDGKYFPYEALITNTNSSAPEYFLKDHIVSYTYSLRFLLNDFVKNKSPSTGNFLGIAPVRFPESFQMTSLQQSDASLNRILSNYNNSHNLIGTEASKANFLQQFPDYKIIQLYTHSSDSSNNKEPVIYFADSALYLSELIPENKNAVRLIVLSACETGNGKLNKGEGVFSFNRGFAALGIPSSIINLWSVDNESTYKLTELFYKYAAQGIPLDISLQKAKLEFIATSSKEKRLPFYWAAAILAGKTDAVEIERSSFWLKIIIAAIIISILLFIVNYNRRNLSAAQGN
jgi:CHAT domain-containing protein